MNKILKDYIPEDDIVILYTNDVHVGISDNLGYAGVAMYKQKALDQTPYVCLVDCGDAVQGGPLATLSHGTYITDIMNKVGYDIAIFGNHEFDWTADGLAEIIKKSNYPYLASNMTYTGNKHKDVFDLEENNGEVVPYIIKEFGKKKVAFVGVETPETITSSTPTYFLEDATGGQKVKVYDFASGEDMYRIVQEYVDEARHKGADYVIVLAHLGLDDESAPNRSIDLIENTSGIDVVLDGHSHSTVECAKYRNKIGKNVLYSQTGTKLQNLGKLTIRHDGEMFMRFVTDVESGIAATAYINGILADYQNMLNEKFGSSEVRLAIAKSISTGTAASRIVRQRETLIGDFCADAYKEVSGADIAFVNGGGIRGEIAVGDITMQTLLSAHPYGNKLMVVNVPGSVIKDALEYACRKTTRNIRKASGGDYVADGENGGFQQVSGIKFDLDVSFKSNVIVEDDFFAGIGGDGRRRVKNIKVYNKETNAWDDIRDDKKYTLASHNYLLENQGDGFSMFKDCEIVSRYSLEDYAVLVEYLKTLPDKKITAAKYSVDVMDASPRIRIVSGDTLVPEQNEFSDLEVI